MSALSSTALSGALRQGLPDIDVGRVRDIIGTFFWQWYVEHVGDVIIRRTILIFKVTIKVRDLNPLFVALFGLNPLPRVGE